jgi:hypothetical protein
MMKPPEIAKLEITSKRGGAIKEESPRISHRVDSSGRGGGGSSSVAAAIGGTNSSLRRGSGNS